MDQKSNGYGKYGSFPETVRKLIQLEKELQHEGYGLDSCFGYMVPDGDFMYFTTPLDSIPFSNPGTDGIHFAFLTDFGTVEKLEEAPIIYVTPMDFDSPVHIVASNIYEFIRLVCTVKSTLVIDNFSAYTSAEEYAQQMDKIDEEMAEYSDYGKEALYVIERLKQTFEIEPLPDVFAYMEEVKKKRGDVIVVSTLDGIGVTQFSAEVGEHTRFPLKRDIAPDVEQVKQFLQVATVESKLALLRDLQVTYHLDDDRELLGILVEEMRAMGLNDEVQRLNMMLL